MKNNKIIIHHQNVDPWRVTVVDTGLNTMTGGRIKRIREYVGDESFIVTYGDAVSDLNIKKLVAYHQKHKKTGTISIYNFGQSKGIIDIDANGKLKEFREKSDDDGALINIGYMVFEPNVFEYIKDDNTIFEQEPMKEMAKNGELMCYKHLGFWQCMDTLREKEKLESMWNSGNAPWKIWED